MKRIIVFFIVGAVATLCSIACKDPYAWYIVEGRLIDKTTKEPVKDVLVAFNKADIIYPINGQKTQKKDPGGGHGYSDTNGEFRTLEIYSTSLLYIYGYSSNVNSLYKDTSISINFSNVPLSGKPSRNYKGDYVLNIGDIELEKIK